MPTPRFNYYPPAGSVVDRNQPRAQWNGRQWLLNGKPFAVPASHSLVGRMGGPMTGWYYDWRTRAWMEPDRAPAPAPRPAAPPRPAGPAPAPAPGAMQPAGPRFIPGRRYSPPRAVPAPVPPAVPERKEPAVEKEKKALTPLDSLMKHPIAPVIGGILMLASYLTEEPQPPTLPDGLPEPLAKQWQMTFNQNQQRFQRRMDLYQHVGMVLLGYASTQTVLDALPPKRSA